MPDNDGDRNPVHRPQTATGSDPQATNADISYLDSTETARKLRAALKRTGTHAFEQDCDLRYTMLYDPHPYFTEETILGKTDADLLSAEDAAVLSAIKRRVIESRETAHEEVCLTMDDKFVYYDLVVEPVIDKAGKVAGIFCVAENFTEKRRLDKELVQSGSRCRSLVDTTCDAIFLLDAESLKFDDVSPYCEQLYGYTCEEFLQMTLLDITAEPVKTKQSIEKALSGGLDRISLHYHRKRDGTVFPVEIAVSTFVRNGPSVLCGVVRDIAERMEAEGSLLESEERFRSIAENAVESIFIKDRTGRYCFVNQAMQKMLGLPMAEIIGRTPSDIYGPEQGRVIAEADQRALSGLNVNESRSLVIRGKEYLVHTIRTPLAVADGEVMSIMGIMRDITDFLRHELELRESEERFRELFSTISDGVAIYTAVDNGNDFVLKDLNPAGQKLSRVELKDIVGWSVCEALPGAKDIGLLDVLQRVYRTGQPERLPLSECRGYRSSDWVEAYVYRLPNGEIVAVYRFLNDMLQLETELQQATKQLLAEQAALENKSTALREVLNAIEAEKSHAADQIQSNLDNVISPLIRQMNDKAGPELQPLVQAVSRSLSDLTSPFVSELVSTYAHLTPSEVRICNLIRNGHSSKEIAAALNLSPETIRSSRKRIRRKLRLVGKTVDLARHLQTLTRPR